MRLFWFILVFSIMCANAMAEVNPSVWASLEKRGDKTVKAKLTSLEMTSTEIFVEYEETDHDKSRGREKLCPDSGAATSASDGYLGAVLNQRMMDLREVLRDRAEVEVVFRGPWNPCILSVRRAIRQ